MVGILTRLIFISSKRLVNKGVYMEKANKGSITLIGEGTYFEGTINVPHCVRIDGSF